ncbi:unnamed protein product [Hymenolepis diminuta]|uniref:Dynein light chain n=1 Tax=Hymenolepis diminuta TaxID=6216 RepID=A0A0R3SJ52_HYMDI|nr:unnamed protein product [Hymenolepis diminuta]VUZ46426.1 unnamed protein product [Hymenolepis diminuta]
MMNSNMIKDEIYKQDMNNEMIKFCQRAARQALQDANSYGNTNNREQTMASSVRKTLENQYPGTWSCVCGQRFGSEVAYIKDHFVFFSVDGMSFMVFKSAEHR